MSHRDGSRESCGTALQRTDDWVTPASYAMSKMSEKWGKHRNILGYASQGKLVAPANVEGTSMTASPPIGGEDVTLWKGGLPAPGNLLQRTQEVQQVLLLGG